MLSCNSIFLSALLNQLMSLHEFLYTENMKGKIDFTPDIVLNEVVSAYFSRLL